jgi:uncharacterized caspase-like protein
MMSEMMSETTSTKPQHWALIIGINQYLQLQPLRCAQQDAQLLRDWLVGAGWPSDNCLLLSDASGAVRGQATYPDRATITAWLDRLKTELLGPEDTLWVFFSGYGECWHREDFLMPCDAQMTVTSDSWISLRSLYSTLKSLPTQNILVLLDSNRSQSVRSGHGVGEHTFKLATDSGIATILSCEPQQFSHESPAMGRGLFTAALLEGLQAHSGEPLNQLVDYLNQRLPELAEHCNTPAQKPLIAVQADRLANFKLPAAPVAPMAAESAAPRSADRVLQPSIRQARVLAADQATAGPTSSALTSPPTTRADSVIADPTRADRPADSLESVLASPPAAAVPSTALMVPPPPESAALTLDRVEPMSPASSRDRSAGQAAQGRSGDLSQTHDFDASPRPGGDTQIIDRRAISPQKAAEASAVETRKFLIQAGGLSGLILIVFSLSSVLKTWTGARPIGTANPSAAGPSTGDRSIGLKASSSQLNPPGSNAAAPNAAPNASPTSNPTAQLPVPQSPSANSAKILADARAQIRPKTASEVALAIGQARQIPPGDVNYAEAQQQIERWSADLLEIAQQRADRGAYQDAIGAAQMITAESARYRAAQTAIGQWKQKLR